MGKDVIDGKWKPMRARARDWPDKLAGDNLGQASGKLDKLIGVLEEQYDYDGEPAEWELVHLMANREAHRKYEIARRDSAERPPTWRRGGHANDDD
jgi:uncharacterized protein YjbJ (UPF0337 family)